MQALYRQRRGRVLAAGAPRAGGGARPAVWRCAAQDWHPAQNAKKLRDASMQNGGHASKGFTIRVVKRQAAQAASLAPPPGRQVVCSIVSGTSPTRIGQQPSDTGHLTQSL